ncbi:MAG: succinate dehydrogenase/fumarate reductase iron-sulfur subunit [Planctomycetota bacterium]|nr:succinate dehydrogenase/fumarate reductase iron-sulfur subunit [Planctomycetota bacterium]
MRLTLHIWQQSGPAGRMETHVLDAVSPDVSFLEMLDMLNEQLIAAGKDVLAFDHDCREGICGMCSLVINGKPHGPETETTTCQLHMRSFNDGDTITIEPFRAKAMPVIKDLVIDRSALDRIVAAGGYVSVNTGNAQDANALPVPRHDAEKSMDAAACIGCAACVASCKNASAMLFVSAKVSQLALLPQGKPERTERVGKMVDAMDAAGFGNCTNEGECEAACPKGISIANIARLNREFLRSLVMPD